MCDEEQSCAQNEIDQACSRLSLTDLPIEIFLHICTFLDAATLVDTLSLACTQFYEILNDNVLWKARISQFSPDTDYPVLPPAEDDEQFWKVSCVALEKQSSLWTGENTIEKLSLSNTQLGTIDGLLLMQNGNICISGARDRSLVCWKLPPNESKKESVTWIDSAHHGWIWDLTAIDNTVYSCSWDKSIKAWTLAGTGLRHFKTYNMYMRNKLVVFTALVINRNLSAALLCITSCAELGLFATGSFCRNVLVFDPRINNPIAKYYAHKGAIISLAMNCNYILSASEDGLVSIWDQRTRITSKNIRLNQKSYPMSMCIQRDMIYVGDDSAKLHVLDPKKDFEPVKCYTTEHKKGINGVHYAPGCLITSSMDETVRIYSPTDPPKRLTTLHSTYGTIAGTDYLNGVLAVSGIEGIDIWRPKS